MQAPPPEVGVTVVKTEPVVLTTELPGRTSAFLVAEIRPQVNGLLQKRLFTEGAEVKKGQVLYQIDPAPFQAALDNAEANLDVARKTSGRAKAAVGASMANVNQQQATLNFATKNRKRFDELAEGGAVSQTERDQAVTEDEVAQAALRSAEAQVKRDQEAVAEAEAAIRQAEAMVESARINLNYTRITAPISGRIGRSAITEGAIVTAFQPAALATIQQMDPIYVDVTQSTSDLLRLRQRMEQGHINQEGTDPKKVKILLEDGTPYSQEGILQFQDVTVDPTTGSVVLRIVVPNPDNVLLPSMFVRAVVTEGMKQDAILVPQQSVARDARGNSYVLAVDSENKVQQKPLLIDRGIGSRWLLLSGLSEGEQVIFEGIQKARPGMTVKPVVADVSQQPDAAKPESK